MTKREAPAIACTLGVGELQTRLAWIARLNAAALRSVQCDGLRLELRYDPQAAEAVRELMRLEQACCAFLTFRLTETPTTLDLTIEAPEAARGAAELMFGQLRRTSATDAAGACCTTSLPRKIDRP